MTTEFKASGSKSDAGVQRPTVSDVREILLSFGAIIVNGVEMREIRKKIKEYYGEEFEDNCLMVIISSGEVVYARTLTNDFIQICTQGTHVCQNKNYLNTGIPKKF